MKTIISTLIFILSLQANALPVANQISSSNPKEIVTVPGSSDGLVNIAAAFEFSNACHASNSQVLSALESDHATKVVIYDLSTYLLPNINALCTADYAPVMQWNIVGQDLVVGSQIVVNGSPMTVLKSPEPAICIRSLCSDGSARDPYTCACSNGLSQ